MATGGPGVQTVLLELYKLGYGCYTTYYPSLAVYHRVLLGAKEQTEVSIFCSRLTLTGWSSGSLLFSPYLLRGSRISVTVWQNTGVFLFKYFFFFC